jgi:modulator of FtsH protease HflC
MKRLLLGLVVLIAIVVAGFASGAVYVVNDMQYAVMTRFGGKIVRVDTTATVGIRVPFYHTLFYYPKRARSIDAPPEHVVTGDSKKLVVDHYAKWRISNPVQFRNRIAKGDAQEKYLRSANERISILTHNALKDVLGTELLADIIAKSRDDMAKEALTRALPEAKELGVELLDIRIKRVDLPKANVEKAYERMQAERFKEANFFRSRGQEQNLTIRAETDKEVVLLIAEAEKQAKIIRAEADAKAAQLYADSYGRDPDFYDFYRSLQALKHTVDDSTTLIISPRSELYKYLITP